MLIKDGLINYPIIEGGGWHIPAKVSSLATDEMVGGVVTRVRTGGCPICMRSDGCHSCGH